MEQPIISATSILLKYDVSSGQWLEMGSQSGNCSVTILKSPANEYRFVGWKESNQEVVLNSFLYPSMIYNESTPTFHQWYDEGKNAYGLNFLDANEAKKFGIAVNSAIEILNSSKITKPGGDNISVSKKSVEKSPGYRTTNRKYSVDRQPSNNPTVSPYAPTGIRQNNDSATVKVPTVPSGKPQVSSSGAPPPPGPPPAAPPPPGPPPSGPPPPGLAPAAPSLPSIKKPAANDLASQLKAKSEAMKSASTNSNAENISRGSPTPPAQSTQPTSSKPPQMDFLSELKLKSQKRPVTQDGINQTKKIEQPRTSATPTVNISSKNPIQSSKPPSSNQDPTTTSFVTSADLEKFRADLLQDIISNMEKFKEDIINGIISKLN